VSTPSFYDLLVYARLVEGAWYKTTLYKRLFKISAFDHEVNQEENSTSNLEFSRAFRCSRTKTYAPLLMPYLHSTFLVLKTGFFEYVL